VSSHAGLGAPGPACAPPAIVLEAVSRRYGSTTVVQDVSFTVARGEIVGFLGPNGAGKTTTMRMIAGYTAATSGRVLVAGHDMATDNVAAARRIGYLPERPPLYDTLDVAAYLRFVAKAKGIPRAAIAAELDRVAVACRLEAVLRREIFKLSRGYRQRVGLAQALLGEPDVLLLDEPTAGLDPAQIHETREVIRAFGERHAVLLSTHILAEATLLCRRVAIIDHGRLLAIDSPAGLQRAVERTNRVSVVVTAPAGDVREALAAVDGVRAVDVREAGRDGRLVVDCHVDAKDGVEAAIARAVTSRWDLHRLERHEPTLENVFIHYVSGR
jgi:ABC-2 type transport system ATP-binding protein